MRGVAGRVLVRWETLLVVAIVAVGIWSVTLSPFFLQRANLLDLVTPYVFIGLMAFGLTFVVITGEIDISVASTLAVSIVSFAQIFAAGANVWVAALIGLAIAGGLGLVNGLLVGVLDLPSLAVTLGTMAAYSGLAFVILSGEGVATFPEGFTKLGGGYLANDELPVALLVMLFFALVLGIVLHGTRFGRYLFAIGSNREAARLSGIPVTRVRVTVFVISGLMAGVAGLVYVGYFGSGARGRGAALAPRHRDGRRPRRRRHLRRHGLDARRVARAHSRRRGPERHAAREPVGPTAEHRHRRASPRGDRRGEPHRRSADR